ncbi:MULTISPECIES: tetratricopeptide repeat protein [Empedobacter]|uniref:tetratricopeptide repeat protein n=1 Tax=Empedobacter TaxID=59734 RepID=UPI001C586EE7|nr:MULTISPECIES: tetratricopeptide repeat protein [Empedobacter]MBW1617877.1 tetratricopeptide repeat protein [Empedobacter falsenii]MDH0675292.1 tetratricopeptide repeat protein [Empedobacter sp. GD03861]
MMYFLKQIGFLGIMLLSVFGYSQSKAKSYIIEGNEYYQKGKFDNAEVAYKKATMEDPTSVKANYNLGNALFQQKRYKESIAHYKRSAEVSKTNNDKHLAYHNLGNAFMQEKDYQNAVDNYKQALRNDPKDDATRYNYALAKKMLEKEREKQKDQNNKDNKDQNKQDQNNQQKQQQQQNKQNQQNQNNQKQNQNQNQSQQQQSDQQKQQNQGGNPKVGGENGNNKGQGNNQSPEIKQGNNGDGKEQDNAKNNLGDGLLKALQNQEAKTQRKIIQQKAEKQRTTTSKDW